MSSNQIDRALNVPFTPANRTNGEPVSDLSILQELKQKTAAHHRGLEETAGIWDCLSSRPAYCKLLVRFRGIYSAGEARLAILEELPRWLPDVSQRWKLSALESDLTVLGVPSESWAVCTGVPDIRTVAAAFGWLYVFEGSTLGGQLIAREVYKRLGLGTQNGCHFFSSYGAEVAQMWKTFGQSLESFSRANPNCGDEVIESAETAFGFFSQMLSGE